MNSALKTSAELADKLLKVSHRLDTEDTLTPLSEHIGDARHILIGEASHSTSEFYSWRARLSRRLIEEKGGETPDTYPWGL
ncbi:hypothetical protein BH24DEI2_BH24DEI2_13590 [soil metagenome]